MRDFQVIQRFLFLNGLKISHFFDTVDSLYFEQTPSQWESQKQS